LPVFISTATDPVVLELGDGDEELAAVVVVVVVVVQRTRPLTSDRTRSEVSVSTREGDEEEMAGVARLATHTTVNRGILLYHMPRYSFSGVELDGEKKPKAKSPPSDTMVVPGRSGLSGTSRSSEAHQAGGNRRRAMVQTKMEVMNAMVCGGVSELWLSEQVNYFMP
jgi:hypothetical protein